MPTTREVTFSIPGWLSVKFEPNQAEQVAAWQLYVELATRVASQRFDRSTGSARGALSSLYELFGLTRNILRQAGPDVARTDKAFGPLAIGFLTEVLAPFLLRWHEPLLAHEATRPADAPAVEHEQNWQQFATLAQELEQLQHRVQAYVKALAEIAGVAHTNSPN